MTDHEALQAGFGESLKHEEADIKLTTLNGLSVGRAVGGAAMGIGMATGAVSPGEALVGSTLLGATDAEGSLYVATRRWPRLQNALRIIPSKYGRILDPVADKIFVASVFLGGMAGGMISPYDGGAILASEAATTAATLEVKHHNDGEEPEVVKAGKVGMVARCGSIFFNLAAAASEDQSYQEALTWAGHGSAGLAVLCGALSIKGILAQRRN